MDSKKMKSIALLGTYFIGLVLIVIRIDSILGGVGILISTLEPLIIGIAIAFVLNRLSIGYEKYLVKICKKNIARGIAIALSYITIIIVIVGIVLIVLPQLVENVMQLYTNIGDYFMNFETVINDFADKYNLKKIDLSAISNVDAMIKEYLEKILTTMTGIIPQVMRTTGSIVTMITTTFISIIVSIYIMTGRDKLIQHTSVVGKTYLSKKYYDKIEYVIGIVSDTFGKFIVGQVTEAIILGSLCFIGMIIFGFEYPLLISTLIGMTALIPVVGAYIGGSVAAFLLFMISPSTALWFMVYLLVLQQIEGNIIYPRVVGNSVGLPAIWVLLSIVVGGSLFGFLGMLIGVPTATVFYRLLKNDVNSRKVVNDKVESEKIDTDKNGKRKVRRTTNGN